MPRCSLEVPNLPCGAVISFLPLEYTTEGGIDTDGNIYVASDGGQPVKMATVQHCIEAEFADDKQTVGLQRCARYDFVRGQAVDTARNLSEEWKA